MDCNPEAAEEKQQTVKASLLASSTSLTLVGIAEAAEKKDEVLDVVEDEPRDPDVTNYGKELLELQRRRRSSLYVKENLAKVLDVREEPFGWVIVLAVFMIHVIVDGSKFGVFYFEETNSSGRG